MSGPIPGGRRRIDRVLGPDFLVGLDSASLDELRGRREDAEQEEVDLSYVRRLIQGEGDAEFCARPEFVSGAQRLGEVGLSFDVCVRHQQLPELFRVSKLASVREFAACVDQWIISRALHLLVGAPFADRIVIVERQAQRVDLLMTGSATRVLRMGLDLHPNGCFWRINRGRRDRLHVGRRGRRRLAENRF